VFDREGELLWKYRDMYRFAVSDSYYVLAGGKPGNEEIMLISAEGVVLQNIKLGELVEKGVGEKDIYVSISPNGRYFALSVRDDSERVCYLYFFENRDFLIRNIKERLLKEIDELIKR